MNQEIIIEKIIKETIDNKGRVTFCLLISDIRFCLWYEFESEYLRFANDDICDAAIVCLLPYAMFKRFNIQTTVPVSEKLLYSVNNYLIPTIAQNIDIYGDITINAPARNIDYAGKHAGTGVSGGVDSFYTILKNIDSHPDESYKNIDTLCIFNVGSHGNGDNGRNLFNQRRENAYNISNELNRKFLCVDSNVDELYKDFGFEETHVFRTLSIPLLFQYYFSTYYFSSSFQAKLFNFDENDPSYYDIFILPNISTENLSFVSVGLEVNRIKKVDFISKFNVVQRYLNVCAGGSFKNCSVCFKCKRTILDLYLVNRLDLFDKCFNVELFKKHKNFYLQYAYSNKHDVDMMEIYNELKKRKEFNFRHFVVDKIIKIRKIIKRLK